jgi:hypothetical protein
VAVPALKPLLFEETSPEAKEASATAEGTDRSRAGAVETDSFRQSAQFGPPAEFVLSELVRQIPSLSHSEALPLSQMITQQLRRWNWPNPRLTFRRTKIVENVSKASVSIIDFQCASKSSLQFPILSPSQPASEQHQYASTLVMSNIADPHCPELQLGCLWAPAYDGKEGITFSKEIDHILPVFRQCSGDEGKSNFRERFANAIAIMAITPLFANHFTTWDPNFSSPDAAIQRACAWGVVAAKSREVEYRLFASSLSCFLNFELQNNLTFTEEESSRTSGEFPNDLCYTLIPYMRIIDMQVRKSLPIGCTDIDIGEKHEPPPPRNTDPMVWSVALETLFRRGQRMVPWRSGQCGSWSLNDKFEEIYLDEYSRDKVLFYCHLLTLDPPYPWETRRISS